MEFHSHGLCLIPPTSAWWHALYSLLPVLGACTRTLWFIYSLPFWWSFRFIPGRALTIILVYYMLMLLFLSRLYWELVLWGQRTSVVESTSINILITCTCFYFWIGNSIDTKVRLVVPKGGRWSHRISFGGEVRYCWCLYNSEYTKNHWIILLKGEFYGISLFYF